MHPIVIFDGIFFFFKWSEIRTWHDESDVGHDGCVRTKVIRAGHESTSCGLRSKFFEFFEFFYFCFVIVVIVCSWFCLDFSVLGAFRRFRLEVTQ